MQKIKYRHVLDTLRNIKQEDNIKHNTISKILGGTPTANALAGRYHSDGYMEAEEIEKIQNKYNYDFYSNSFISINNEGETVTLDYYPDVFGSCGTGYFVSSEEKEQIQVPVNALRSSGSAEKILQEHKQANRYNTGEIERIEAIKNEKIESMPPEYFANIRKRFGWD